jgi:tetratricopeptide (TPR) repeat protein
MSHLSENEVERLLAARLGPAERERVVRHLSAGCGLCSRRLVEQAPDRLLQEAADGRRRKAGPDSLRDHTLAIALKQEARWRTDEKKLARSLEILRASPRGYDDLSFRQVQALHGQPLVEALLQRSFELRYRDPKGMRWLAYNAVKAAESLRAEDHGPLFLFDMQARAWAELGNAYKVCDEYAEAEAAFRQARALLRQGSGDLRLLARLATLEASFRSTQRRLAEAHELFDGIYRIYLRLEDQHLAGLTLISKGICSHYEGRSRQAVESLRAGLSLTDSDRDEPSVSAGRQSLVTTLAGCGEYRQAGEVLLKSGLRQAFAEDPLNLLRLRWSEGKILAGIRNISRAEHALLEVHAGFLDLGQEAEVAFVGLDLIPVLLQQGKSQAAREVARLAYGRFRDLGIHQEAAKARRYLV